MATLRTQEPHREFISLRVHQNVKSSISKDTIRSVREHRVRRDCLDTQGTESSGRTEAQTFQWKRVWTHTSPVRIQKW